MSFVEIFILIYAFVMIGIILYYSWVHHKMMKEIKKEIKKEREVRIDYQSSMTIKTFIDWLNSCCGNEYKNKIENIKKTN